MASVGVHSRVGRLFYMLLLVVIAGSALFAVPARAQDERVTVRVDGAAVLRVGPLGEIDAATRARRIETRIAALLENPRTIGPAVIDPPVTADPDDTADRVVNVSGVPVVTVTQADAEDNLLPTTSALAVQWAQAIDTALRAASERRQTGWGRFVAEVRASVANAFGNVGESLITIVPRAIAAVLVILLFWLVAIAVRWATVQTLCHLSTEPTIQNLIKQLAYYSIWVLGFVVAIDALGFDPEAVATGLGLTGLALGFALREVISNFVSGLLILGLRPFRIGDQIIVGETEGSVERIELRATQILSYDGRRILVPNADVFTARVTNNTASPVRRAAIDVFVDYDIDLEHAIAVAREATSRTTGVLDTPPPAVLVGDMQENNVRLEIRFWTDSRRIDFVGTMSAVRREIVAAFKAEGLGLPEPQVRDLRLREAEDWQAALAAASVGEE